MDDYLKFTVILWSIWGILVCILIIILCISYFNDEFCEKFYEKFYEKFESFFTNKKRKNLNSQHK